MKLRTEYDPKPIPIREFDWSAIDDDTYDVGGLIGWGTTEAEAVAELLERMEDGTDRQREDALRYRAEATSNV